MTDEQAVGEMMADVRSRGGGNTVAFAFGLFAAAVGGCLFTTWWCFAIGFGFGVMPASVGKDLFAALGGLAAVASICLVIGSLILAILSIFKPLRRRVLAVAGLLIALPPAVMIIILAALK